LIRVFDKQNTHLPTGGQPFSHDTRPSKHRRHAHSPLFDIKHKQITSVVHESTPLPHINELIEESIVKDIAPILEPTNEKIIINFPMGTQTQNSTIKNPNVKANYAMIEDLFALNLYDPHIERPSSSTESTIMTPNATIQAQSRLA
jgi:hypothetical protein